MNKLFIIFLVSFKLAASTLEQVKERGYLKCGVSGSLPGFSFPDNIGHWEGIDVDFCRAVAAAIFDNQHKVEFTPLSTSERFEALKTGEIDILSRNTTWNMTRDVKLEFEFPAITYYDGQGFMLSKTSGVTNVSQINGASICSDPSSTTIENLKDFLFEKNYTMHIITNEINNKLINQYENGECDIITGDKSSLAGIRNKLGNPEDHVILPDIISKEPLGPVVRSDDNKWADLVRWVIYGIINAEELMVNRNNVQDLNKSDKPKIRKLLGIDSKLGTQLGLDNNFMYKVISSVGNYQEIYNRNIGRDSDIKIYRGLNNLWKNGGILFAPPFT